MHSPLRLALAVSAVAVCAVGCSKNAEPPVTRTAMPAAQTATEIRTLAADLPLLPASVANGARPLPVVKAAFEFAARHPEVMNFVPCFCGCERLGHSGNHDCFVAGRDDAGNVTEWESHGVGCQVCIDVAVQARELFESGADVATIRATIDERYANAALRTPTPTPRSGGGHH
jgi:hypothetical protein